MCGEPIKPLMDLLIQNVSYRGLCFGCASTLEYGVRARYMHRLYARKRTGRCRVREGALVTVTSGSPGIDNFLASIK